MSVNRSVRLSSSGVNAPWKRLSHRRAWIANILGALLAKNSTYAADGTLDFDHDAFGDEEAAPGPMPASADNKGKVTGRTAGLDSRILDVLKAVATKHSVNVHVTSGKRNAAAQGRAMFDNWEKLERGKVYKTSALPVEMRTKLDGLFEKAKSGPEKAKYREDFIKIAGDQVGKKSRHAKGQAVDLATAPLSEKATAQLLIDLKKVIEGKRQDILHLELP